MPTDAQVPGPKLYGDVTGTFADPAGRYMAAPATQELANSLTRLLSRYQRTLSEWDGHCLQSSRKCEARDLCIKCNSCFRNGDDTSLVNDVDAFIDLRDALLDNAEILIAALRGQPNSELTDAEVAKTGQQDTGYCNPLKMRQAVEARSAAIQELMHRGHTKEAAEALVAR